MKNKLSSSINAHSFPRIFFSIPFLLRIYHIAICITTLRNWYCFSEIKKALCLTSKNFSLLDAGCGAGDYLLPLSKKYPNSHFTGIDRAKSNIDVCKNYVIMNKTTNCSFIMDDLESLNINSRYDFILCLTVLQYIENDLSVLLKFNSIL